MPVLASSKSVHVKCHPGAFSALHSTELSHTHSQYTGSIPQPCSSTRGNRKSISDFVVYKTTTNVCCFAAGRPQQL